MGTNIIKITHPWIKNNDGPSVCAKRWLRACVVRLQRVVRLLLATNAGYSERKSLCCRSILLIASIQNDDCIAYFFSMKGEPS